MLFVYHIRSLYNSNNESASPQSSGLSFAIDLSKLTNDDQRFRVYVLSPEPLNISYPNGVVTAPAQQLLTSPPKQKSR